MSEVSTSVVNVQEQVEQAAQLSAEQQAEVLEQAKKELGLVVKALKNGNRENSGQPVPGRAARAEVHQPGPQGRQEPLLGYWRAGA